METMVEYAQKKEAEAEAAADGLALCDTCSERCEKTQMSTRLIFLSGNYVDLYYCSLECMVGG